MTIRLPAAALSLLLSGLVAAAAVAKADPPAAATPAPQTPTSASNILSGVTVQAPAAPRTACGSRDRDCVAAVVADLKARYPKALQRWCDNVEQRAAQQNLTFHQEPTTDHPHGGVMPYRAPEVTKVACTGIPK